MVFSLFVVDEKASREAIPAGKTRSAAGKA
jgi:hypothetical protein